MIRGHGNKRTSGDYLNIIEIRYNTEKNLGDLRGISVPHTPVKNHHLTLVMKSGKRRMTDGMELPNHDKIRTLGENETYKYLGILEADTIKQVEMKDKI